MKRRTKLVVIIQTALLALLMLPAGTMAATYYLRPDGKGTNNWNVVGATSAWDALNDGVTEAETPALTDDIEQTAAAKEEEVTLTTTNIFGVKVTKAELWYYAGNNQPFEVKSSADTTWQTSNSTGWHSKSQNITSQSALDNLVIRFRTSSTKTSTPRQVQVAFLKIETDGPHVYWGAWMNGDVYKSTNPGLGDAPWDKTTWDLFEAHAEKHVSVVHFGQLPPWEQEFTASPLELTRKRDALPMMDMGTGYIPGYTHSNSEPDNRVSLKEINEGTYDSYFEKWAKAAANYSYPFFFRWGWEMNGTWYKWGKDAAEKPAEYVQAWQRIHNIASKMGASNITWVWCPNVEFSGSTPLAELYPGNEFVDWTCLDGYNKAEVQFESLFKNSYTALTSSIAPTKPVMIGETATVNEHLTASEWIRNAIQSLPGSFPKVKAFLWFNWNIVEKEREWEWPIELDGGQATFASEIKTPYFAENEFGAAPALKAIEPLP